MAVRVDKWLWSVRIYKTRRQAADACAAGRVRINGDVVKPAAKVMVKIGFTVVRLGSTNISGRISFLEVTIYLKKKFLIEFW